MNKPLVSITSAFYNEQDKILDMVRSIVAQTFSDWELILLNDGSTDKSLELVKSINDPRIRVFSNGANRGRAASLNYLTKLAKGKYIARMDADDICSTERIKKQVELIESKTDIDLVGTGLCYLDKYDNPIGHVYAKPNHPQITSNPERTFGIAHGSLLGKRCWFEKNPYNEKYALAIDFNLFLRTYHNSIFANVPEPLYYYRLDQSFSIKQQFVARNASAKFLFQYFVNNREYIKALKSTSTQYCKFIATLILIAMGKRKNIMQRRFTALTPNEVDRYRNEIDIIKNTPISIKE